MATSNKGYVIQSPGDSNWGTILNQQMIEYVDLNVGGTYSLDISSPLGIAPNGTFTVSDPDNKNAILVLSGNPSYATWTNITITVNDLKGYLFVQNKITFGIGQTQYPQIRIKNSASGTYAIVPANSQVVLISDPSNGVRIAGQDGFESGTALTFIQASAPTGWTKSTTHNNKALRIVSSSGGGSGGSTAFTSVFTARTITQANLPNVTLTSNTTGSHVHPLTMFASGQNDPFGGNNHISTGTSIFSGPFTPTYLTMSYAGDHFHTVSLGGSGTTMDFDVQYVDSIICTKD